MVGTPLRGRGWMAGLAGATALAALVGCAPSGSGGGTSQSGGISTEIGPKPVTITVRANEDQKQLWEALADGFEEDFPSVSVVLETEAFQTLQQNAPRYLASADAPDLLRLAAPGDAVSNGLLRNLDAYAEAYGWDEFPASQLEQWQFNESGTVRGVGSLYALGVGFGLVGVYVNTAEFEAIGGSELPRTLEEFEQLLADAADAGKTALVADVPFLFQAVALSEGQGDEVSKWTFGEPGASLDDPETVASAATVQRWIEAGYLPPDVASADATANFGRFSNGDGVFFHSGSWFAKALDAAQPGAYGFFLLPPAQERAPFETMSAPNAAVIPAAAKHPDEAAAFLNWINSPAGQDVLVEVGGLAPGGAGQITVPAGAEDSAFGETLAAFQRLSADDGLVDFLANATAGMASSALVPQSQLLAASRITPEEFVSALQDEFESSRAGD